MLEQLILSALQKHLKNQLPDRAIYLTVPPQAIYPCTHLETLEWTGNNLLGGLTQKMKFQASCLSQNVGMSENSHQSAEINAVIDGLVLGLDNGIQVSIRHITTCKDGLSKAGAKILQNHYTALIRQVQ